MSESTALLDALPPGDAASAAQLLPLVYDDLRRLAAHRHWRGIGMGAGAPSLPRPRAEGLRRPGGCSA